MTSQRDDEVFVILIPFSRSQKDSNASEEIDIYLDQTDRLNQHIQGIG